MRVMFLFLVVVLLIGFVSATIPGDCDYSMEAYWKMDEDATDSSGEGHDGTGFPDGVFVLKNGNAAGFDGNDKITVLDIGNVFQFGFTIEMWIQKNGVPVADMILFKKGDYIIKYLADGKVRGSVGGVEVTSGFLNPDVPYYVAMTWEPNSKSLVLYIDGNSVESETLSSPSIYVGNVEMGEGFIGLMDEVAVYSRAFDMGDIAFHYSLSDANKDYCDSSGVNETSTTKSDFNIAGCSLPMGGGLAVNTCSRREIDGEYFCDNSKTLWETREIGLGCSLGSSVYNLGEPFCCPAGMFCNATGGAFRCDYRLEQCYDQTNKEDCEAIGCVWLSEAGICSDGTRDYACSLYENEEECLSDIWNLGRTGIGTEVCGSYIDCGDYLYTIPYESCECRWDDVAESCGLYMEGAQTYYDDEDLKQWFSCLKNYTIGDCIEGEQDVFWDAIGVTYNEFPEECLNIMGCSDGSSTRVCGEPVIKLPGFSLFGLFVSVVVIGAYYVRRVSLYGEN